MSIVSILASSAEDSVAVSSARSLKAQLLHRTNQLVGIVCFNIKSLTLCILANVFLVLFRGYVGLPLWCFDSEVNQVRRAAAGGGFTCEDEVNGIQT